MHACINAALNVKRPADETLDNLLAIRWRGRSLFALVTRKFPSLAGCGDDVKAALRPFAERLWRAYLRAREMKASRLGPLRFFWAAWRGLALRPLAALAKRIGIARAAPPPSQPDPTPSTPHASAEKRPVHDDRIPGRVDPLPRDDRRLRLVHSPGAARPAHGGPPGARVVGQRGDCDRGSPNGMPRGEAHAPRAPAGPDRVEAQASSPGGFLAALRSCLVRPKREPPPPPPPTKRIDDPVAYFKAREAEGAHNPAPQPTYFPTRYGAPGDRA